MEVKGISLLARSDKGSALDPPPFGKGGSKLFSKRLPLVVRANAAKLLFAEG